MFPARFSPGNTVNVSIDDLDVKKLTEEFKILTEEFKKLTEEIKFLSEESSEPAFQLLYGQLEMFRQPIAMLSS